MSRIHWFSKVLLYLKTKTQQICIILYDTSWDTLSDKTIQNIARNYICSGSCKFIYFMCWCISLFKLQYLYVMKMENGCNILSYCNILSDFEKSIWLIKAHLERFVCGLDMTLYRSLSGHQYTRLEYTRALPIEVTSNYYPGRRKPSRDALFYLLVCSEVIQIDSRSSKIAGC